MQLLFNSYPFLLLFLPAMLLGWWPAERRAGIWVRRLGMSVLVALLLATVSEISGVSDAWVVVPLAIPAVLLGWWVTLDRPQYRLGYLALMSWLFYVLSYHEGSLVGLALLPLMLFSTTIDFWAGRRIDGALQQGEEHRPRAKRYLQLALALNLGILAAFKYSGLFAASLNEVWGLFTSGGDAVSIPDVILPIGISFYTFNSMSYTIDVYRGKVQPARSLLEYAAFVALFPHLIAGPIVRYSEIDVQLRSLHRRLTPEMASLGVWFLVVGLFKKVVVANALAGHVDRIYAQSGDMTVLSSWAATLAYGFQLYFDFSAYSDMAVGLALLMGLQFPQNFNSPFKALNPSDFWRRWHMTLSRWLTDYLYIALGGNRRGRLITLRNLFLTMFLGGLWHGAGWVFALWGMAHGLGLVVHRIASDAGWVPARKWVARSMCFGWITLLWPAFRSGELTFLNAGQSTEVMRNTYAAMFGANGLGLDALTVTSADGMQVPLLLLATIAALLAFVNVAPNVWEIRFRPTWRFSLASAGMATASVMLLAAPSPFLYFQF